MNLLFFGIAMQEEQERNCKKERNEERDQLQFSFFLYTLLNFST